MKKILAALGLWLALGGAAAAQTCPAYSFTFTPGTNISSSQVNANFATIRTCANSNLAPLATPSFTGPVTITGTPLGISSGGTGASTAAAALSSLGAVGLPGPNNFTGANNEAFATIASAATTNIGAAAANYLQVTGTTGITAFDTIQAGTERTLEFAGALTLTNSSAVILLGGGNYTTAAGDVLKFRSEGSGNWRQVTLGRASGLPVLKQQVFTGNGTFTAPANTNTNTVYKLTVVGGGGGGGGTTGASQVGGGGGGGATAIFWGSGIASGATVAVTVGGGGTSGAGNGGAGGNSTAVFNGTTITANGGGGGPGNGGTVIAGAAGGTATNGTINSQGGPGGPGLNGNISGGGGNSSLGGGGAIASGGNGNAGGNFGGGGGGSSAGTFSGGGGAPGIVLVEWVQ